MRTDTRSDSERSLGNYGTQKYSPKKAIYSGALEHQLTSTRDETARSDGGPELHAVTVSAFSAAVTKE